MTAPAAETPRLVRTPWALVTALAAMTAFGAMSVDMYLPALPEMADHLGATPKAAQWTVSIFFVGMGFGQLLYGPASDRWGRRPAIFIGIAVYVTASIICALATNIETLLVARLAQALGGCAGIVIGRAAVRDRYDHVNAARILSMLSLIMGVAPLLAPFIGAAILEHFGWRPIFGTLAGFGVCVFVTVFFVIPESRSAATAAKARGENALIAYTSLLAQPRFVGYFFAGGLNGACLLTYIASAPAVLMEYYGMAASDFPWFFGVNAIAIAVGAQLNRILLRWYSPDGVLSIVMFMATTWGVVLAFSAVTGIGGMYLVLTALAGVLASYGVITGNTMAGALSVDPHRAGSASAIMGTGSYGLGAIISTLVALASDGTPAAFGIAMLLCLVGSASSFWLIARPRKQTVPA